MQIISDVISLIRTLSFVDIVFFLAVLALMLLVIILIYFLRENNGEVDNELEFKIKDNSQEDDELTSLKAITEALENAEASTINLSKYEEEQEEKAIISYDELLKRRDGFALNYVEEENISDDLTIKKVDLDNLINKDVPIKPEIKVSIISYDKEEAFLEALKQLQQKLN